MMRGERGQAGVEFALMLPILLFILLGIADLGRAYYYSSAVASAAHSAASAYARDRNANVQTAACGALGSACAATVETAGCPGGPVTDAAVQVIYRFELISGFLVVWIFGNPNIAIRACATSPRITQ